MAFLNRIKGLVRGRKRQANGGNTKRVSRNSASQASNRGSLAPRTPPQSPAVTQNYVAELRKLAESTKHAEGRLRLQLKRLAARPNLAQHLERTRRNLTRAKQITAAVDAQYGKARKGQWSANAISYKGPGRWSYVPGVDQLSKRISGRVAARNTLLGGPTLNSYHVKHGAQMSRAQAALNALTTGSRLVNANEARLLRGQLKRVMHKKSKQGLLFDWEKKLLANKALVQSTATLYAANVNTPRNAAANRALKGGAASLSFAQFSNLRSRANTAYRKARRGLPLNEWDQAALLYQANVENAAPRFMNWK